MTYNIYKYELTLYEDEEEYREETKTGIVFGVDFSNAVTRIQNYYGHNLVTIKCEEIFADQEEEYVLPQWALEKLGYVPVQTGNPEDIGYTPVN